MTFEPDEPEIALLMQKLTAATLRGVTVHLAVDAFPFMLRGRIIPGPLWFRKELDGKMQKRFRLRYESLQTLKDSGGVVVVVNPPLRKFSLPHAGRCHIKTAIINDKVYVGGCNLSESELDVMVGWQDKQTADWLGSTVLHIMKTGRARAALHDTDTSLQLDEKTQLLIDAGIPDQSVIYDETLRLIDSAQEWLLLTCQYFPGGRTSQHLLKAHKRGVRVQIVYGHPLHQGIEFPAHYLYNLRERTRLPKQFFEHRIRSSMPRLHAKLLATDQGGMIGSHNLTTQGVGLGTAELALLRRDSNFAIALAQNMLSQLAEHGMKLTR